MVIVVSVSSITLAVVVVGVVGGGERDGGGEDAYGGSVDVEVGEQEETMGV